MGLASEKWIFFAAGPDERSDIGSPLFIKKKVEEEISRVVTKNFNQKYEP